MTSTECLLTMARSASGGDPKRATEWLDRQEETLKLKGGVREVQRMRFDDARKALQKEINEMRRRLGSASFING